MNLFSLGFFFLSIAFLVVTPASPATPSPIAAGATTDELDVFSVF